MIDLLIQHLLKRIADYIEINHRMQIASSEWDRISAGLISSQIESVVLTVHIFMCLVTFFNIANNLDGKNFFEIY